MAVSTPAAEVDQSRARAMSLSLPEIGGIAALFVLLGYFLHVSWLRWPDPLIDSGPQWYAAWRISEGASLFANYQWTYGPLSAYFNGLVFQICGAQLHTLFAVNLLIYCAILALAYAAFRRAWGWLAAFAACATFISVFSFSILNSVGNYNYASPYSHESAHGMALLLATVFIAARWANETSPLFAFLLGTCGGVAAILKPEFMLAGGVLGISALAMRFLQLRSVSALEWALLVLGVALPTLAFTAGFALHEPLQAAFAHAANAWWIVLVKPISVSGFGEGMKQLAGLDHPYDNLLLELKAGLIAILVIAAIRVGGVISLAAVALAWAFNDPNLLGRAFPLVTLAALIFIAVRLWKQWKHDVKFEPPAVMQWMLAVAAAAMLARMALLSRVDHIGFFQAALAGMLAAGFMVGEAALKPRNLIGISAGLVILTLSCGGVAQESIHIHGDQSQPVGSDADRFYAFDREIDPTAALVDWTVQKLQDAPRNATVQVIPDGWDYEVSEGLSINFLSRHVSPIPFVSLGSPEDQLLDRLKQSPPDIIVEISGNFPGKVPAPYGKAGGPGGLIIPWINQNYTVVSGWGEPFSGGQLKGAHILTHQAQAP